MNASTEATMRNPYGELDMRNPYGEFYKKSWPLRILGMSIWELYKNHAVRRRF